MQSAPKLTALPHFKIRVTVRSRVSSLAMDGFGPIICKNGLEPTQTRHSVQQWLESRPSLPDQV